MLPLLLLFACNEYEVLTDTREQDFTETFEVAGARTDILFYGDTSHSMERELLELGDAIDEFVARVEENSADWRMLAVTGPTGCGVEGIFTPETADLRSRFAGAIRTPPGGDDVDEWGLFNVYKAVLESGPGGCNEGFVRDEATLHVVFLSDEPDSSPGWQMEGEYWRDYVDPILYLKDDPAQVRFSAIVGPTPSGCQGAAPGFGYADAARATGGETLSICADWSSDVDVLADASIQVAFFALAHEPILETVQVAVDDEPRETGWAYDAEAGGIRFSEDLPGAWDEVRVQYRAVVEVEVTD